MKIPEKTAPILFALLIIAAFLIGRYQGQLEMYRAGGVKTENAGSGSQANVQGAQQAQGQADQQPVSQLSEEQWSKLTGKWAASKGDENAPVTIVEFTDFQCPYCTRYIVDTHSQIDDEYISKGKVRFLIRDLPLPFHTNSSKASQAARCAGDEGKYWEMHDLIFDKQSDWSTGDPTEKMITYASDIGISGNNFSDCLKNEKYKAAVEEDLAMAQELGVSGTPGFFINGKLLIGAQPFSAFQQVIDEQL